MSTNLQCKNLKNNNVIFSSLEKPTNFFKRNNGLMFRKKLLDHEALMITGCNFIHTFFMKFSIDVIYLSKKMEIKEIKKDIKPYRLTLPVFGASSVIECAAGNVNISELSKGDKLYVGS